MPPIAPARRRDFIDRPDCRIAYEVVGEGPPLVFAHGLGGSLMSWWQQVGHFAGRYTCVTFSHRGFWPSTAPEGGPDPAAYAGDLAALVDHLGLGEIRLVCQSMGGWTGVEYALRRPGRVTALVLAATTGSIDPQQFREPERACLDPWTAESTAARQAMAGRGVHPAAGARMAREQPAQHLLYSQIDSLSAGLDKEAVRSRLTAMRRRAPAELAEARCPILCIAGSEDMVIPPFAATALAAAVPGARAALVPEAGHSVYFERPAAFNALVDAFFTEAG